MASTGELKYELVRGWEQLPEGFKHLDCVGAGIDANDRVYVITRMDARVIVYEPDGSFVTSWGEGIFTPRTHCIKFAPDGSVYTADDGNHTIRKFSPTGELLMTLGTPGVGSDTGYVPEKGISSITHGGPPFNRPTGVALAPGGELYVCDGYGNARVHRFTSDGKLIQSWGEPGTGPGEFNLPHDIWVRPDGTVMVADRENDRIQFFSPDGKYLYEWTDVQRPTGLAMDREGRTYVTELWWRVGQTSFRHGKITEDRPGRVSVFDREGNVLARFGHEGDRTAPGNFIAPHGIGVDSHGDVYVAEVTETFGVKGAGLPSGFHSFQKFRKV
ncbi:MAG TPA: peptidyl-alpha-hydroxyglycine alpha-amidating lyase family protein [Chloroflexota bacterium]